MRADIKYEDPLTWKPDALIGMDGFGGRGQGASTVPTPFRFGGPPALKFVSAFPPDRLRCGGSSSSRDHGEFISRDSHARALGPVALGVGSEMLAPDAFHLSVWRRTEVHQAGFARVMYGELLQGFVQFGK